MRILMLSGAYPLPPDNGAKRRILATASHFSQYHDLTLVSLRADLPSVMLSSEIHKVPWQDHVVYARVNSRLQAALIACFSKNSYGQVKYWNRNLQSVVERILTTQHFDCVWVHLLNMVTYIKHCFVKSQSGQRQSLPLFVLDQHNVDEMYYRSFLTSKTNAVWKLFAMLEMFKAQHLQKRWFPRFDAILCVAPEDLQKTAEYLNRHTGLWLAPNGVDIEYFQPVTQQELMKRTSILVFGGSLDVTMNQDAVRWFSHSVLPLIKQQVPDVQFYVVGRDPPPEIRSLADRREITITGTVADVREYYRQATVFVVPLRIGGGTKLKTLEAMAMGLPIVSTAVGAQGLDVKSGRHLYIADSPERFTAYAVGLLKDREKAVSMGAEVRRLVERKYSWRGIMGDVDHKLTNLFREKESQKG
jgi:glycosyltransferase involved in cell wall biosynthesis